MGVDETSAWYVVRTKPRAEAMAATNLRVKCIEVYLPKLVVGFRKQAAGIATTPTEPLFPGYLFARLVLSRQFHLAAWTPGVSHLLGASDRLPIPIDEAIVESLRQRAGGGDTLEPRPQLRAGDQVEIRTGPFAGLLAIIDRPCSAVGRVQILLDFLRRQTRLELPVSAVAPV